MNVLFLLLSIYFRSSDSIKNANEIVVGFYGFLIYICLLWHMFTLQFAQKHAIFIVFKKIFCLCFQRLRRSVLTPV